MDRFLQLLHLHIARSQRQHQHDDVQAADGHEDRGPAEVILHETEDGGLHGSAHVDGPVEHANDGGGEGAAAHVAGYRPDDAGYHAGNADDEQHQGSRGLSLDEREADHAEEGDDGRQSEHRLTLALEDPVSDEREDEHRAGLTDGQQDGGEDAGLDG